MRYRIDCFVEYMEHSCDYKRSLNSRTILKLNYKYKLNIRVQLYPSLLVRNKLCKSTKSNSSLISTNNSINGFSNLGLILFSVIFIFMPQIINSKPLVKSSIRPNLSSDTFSYAMDFLVKYGYLPKSDFESGNLRSEDHLKHAISTMQRFGNLPPTGILDNTTLALMRRKRCGVPDYFGASHDRVKRYALQGSKWQKNDLTWSVKHWSRDIDSQYVLKELKKAFKVWSDVSKLTFTETRKADADIVISFLSGLHGDEYPFDGPGSILAHAFFPGQGIGGDTHFDADEQWSKKRYNHVSNDYDKNDWEGVSLFSVASHEFGHSLGLSHSSVTGSLMFPYYQTINDDFKLPNDDVVGIQQLYGSRTSTKWAPLLPLPTPRYPEQPLTKRPQIGHPARPKTTFRPMSTSPSIPEFAPNIPNPCNTSFDAIASIRRDIFIFKGKYFWWLKDNRTLDRYQPIEVYHYWIDLPENIEKIDAVYERQSDKKIVFFIGKKYWIFNNNNRVEAGYPRPLTDIGLPPNLEKIDAAMIWGHNGKTYLFSGSLYWRFEEEDNRVELDYPRDMSVWRGIPYNIDSAFQWSIDSHTYFFKENQFWRFDNRKMKVSEDYPQSISDFWFESLLCKNKIKHKVSANTPSDNSSNNSINSCATHKFNLNLNMILIIALLFYNFYTLSVLYNRLDMQ